jgi:hypothetical protein
MTKQSLPAVSTLTSETLEEFKTADKIVLVAFFAADDKASNTTFNTVADSMRDDYLFGATNDAALAKAEGVKQPGIVLYKDFDEGKNVFEEKFDVDAITQFAQTASTPLVGEVGPETYAGYMAVSLKDWSHCHIRMLTTVSRLVFLLHTSLQKLPRSGLSSLQSSSPLPRSTRAKSTLPQLMPKLLVHTPET